MTAVGHERRIRTVCNISAFTPRSRRRSGHRFALLGAKNGRERVQQNGSGYSITSSARPSSGSGWVATSPGRASRAGGRCSPCACRAARTLSLNSIGSALGILFGLRKHAPNSLDQGLEFDRFGSELVAPRRNGLLALAVQRIRGHADDRDVAGLWIAPVTLPPGRPRLATTPVSTGSVPSVKTMGMWRSPPWPR
jgi:hypothetical protein